MGLIDKAGDLVGTAAGRVSAALSDLPDLPGVDVERLRIVIEVVWENKDLLIKLPSVLGDTGEQMQAAGAGAREVGGFLSGEVHELTAQAADTLEACRKPLAQVGEVFDELGAVLDRLPLVGNVAEPATRGLGALSEVATNIERVSVQLRGLSASMQGAGAGLDAMGASLQGGGVALATLSGRTIAQAAAARRQTSEEPSTGGITVDPVPEPIMPTRPAGSAKVAAKRPTAKSSARKGATKGTSAKKRAPERTATNKASAKKVTPKKATGRKASPKMAASPKATSSTTAEPTTAGNEEQQADE